MTLEVPKYALGVALWAAAELKLELPEQVLRHIETVIRDRDNWQRFRAQDLGMILVGVAEQSKLDPKKWFDLAADLFTFLVDKYHSRSGLFYDAAFDCIITRILCQPDLSYLGLLFIW